MASAPIHSFINEFNNLLDTTPHSIDALREKVDKLSLLIKQNSDFIEETTLTKKIEEISASVHKVSESELKSSSEEMDKSIFIKVNADVVNLFYLVNKVIEGKEAVITDSLIKIFHQMGKKEITEKEENKFLSCLSLIKSERNHLKIVQALLSNGCDILEKNLEKFKLSNENRFSVIKELLKKPFIKLSTKSLIFIDPAYRDVFAKILAEKHPFLLWNKTEDKESNYLGITNHSQLVELIKISYHSQADDADLWHITNKVFGNDKALLFELTKIFIQTHNWQDSWKTEIFKFGEDDPNITYWPKIMFVELLLIGFESKKILKEKKMPARNDILIELEHHKYTEDINYRSLVLKLGTIFAEHVKDFVEHRIDFMEHNINLGEHRLDDFYRFIETARLEDKEIIYIAKANIHIKDWISFFNMPDDRYDQNNIFNPDKNRFKENFYPDLIEIARLVFFKNPDEIIHCKWLKEKDFLSLASEILERNPTIVINILELGFHYTDLFSRHSSFFNKLIDLLISGDDGALKNDSSLDDKYLSRLKLVILHAEKILTEKKILDLINKCAYCYPEAVKTIFDKTYKEDFYKEHYNDFLKMAEIGINFDPILISKMNWLNIKDYLPFAKKVVSINGLTLEYVKDKIFSKPELNAIWRELAIIALSNNICALQFCLDIKNKEDFENLNDFVNIVFNSKIINLFMSSHPQDWKLNGLFADEDKFYTSLNIAMKKFSDAKLISEDEAKIKVLFLRKELLIRSIKEGRKIEWDYIPKEIVFDVCKFAIKNGVADAISKSISNQERVELSLLCFEKCALDFIENENLDRIINRMTDAFKLQDPRSFIFEHSFNKKALETKYRGLSLIKTPKETFVFLKQMKFKEDDLIYTLLMPLFKKFEQLPEENRLEFLTNYEQSFIWLGYFDLKWNLLNTSEKSIQPYIPAVRQIMELQFPQLRYDLSQVLFDHFLLTPAIEEESKERVEEPLFKITGDSGVLFQTLLFPLMSSSKGDWKVVTKILSHFKFHSGSAKIALLVTLRTIIENDSLSLLEKGNFLKSLFNYIESKDPDEILSLMRLTDSLFSINVKEYLKKLIDPSLDLSNPRKTLEAMLLDIFCSKLELGSFEGFEKRFGELIRVSRQPGACFLYFAKLQNLRKGKREMSLKSLKEFISNLIRGHFPEIRYRIEGNLHIKQLVEKMGTKFNIWKTGETASVTELLKAGGETISPIKKKKFNSELNERILIFKHFDFLDQSSTEPSFLKRYTETSSIDVKMKLISALNDIDKELKAFEKIKLKMEKDTYEKELLKLKIYQTKLQIQRILIYSMEPNCAKPNIQIEKALELIREKFNASIDAIDDLKLCLRMIDSNKLTKIKYDLNRYIIVDTDHWEDLLLCGTEVQGSCQHIERDPNNNMCLLGYITDGKIRVVAVKDDNGKIVGRRILRLLIDKKTGKPVIYQERLYSNVGIPKETIQALDVMVLRKAQKMGIPLLSAKEVVRKEDIEKQEAEEKITSSVYPSEIESLSSPSPFEYVDAGGIGITEGEYTIPSSCMRIRWKPEEPKLEPESNTFYDQLNSLHFKLLSLAK